MEAPSAASADGERVQWRAKSFLASLNPASLERVIKVGTRRTFGAGETLVRHGDPSDHVFAITSGVVKIEAVTPEGDRVTLAWRGPGDVVGELSAITGEGRSATVQAVLEVSARLIRNRDFTQLLQDDPSIALALTKMIAQRLASANQQRLSFASQSVITRLAGVLEVLADSFGHQEAAGTVIDIPITQSDLASMIGAAEVSVHKALRTLRNEGVIRVGYRRVVITDRSSLQRIAHADSL